MTQETRITLTVGETKAVGPLSHAPVPAQPGIVWVRSNEPEGIVSVSVNYRSVVFLGMPEVGAFVDLQGVRPGEAVVTTSSPSQERDVIIKVTVNAS